MRALLDTHVFLWLASDPDKVPQLVRTDLENADERLISSASAYEIAFKTRLGKLPGGEAAIGAWNRLLIDQQAVELPLTVAHMTTAGSLSWDHRDPFDRMLVAQAQVEGLVLATGDRRLIEYREVATVRWE